MNKTIFGGISGIQVKENEYRLGEGIVIRKVYAHLFSPYMMSFNPPRKYKHHEGPWKSAKGGSAFDIHFEIEVPDVQFCHNYLSQEDLLFLIGFLFKISSHPYASIPVISDISFSTILETEIEPQLMPYETKQRIFLKPQTNFAVLEDDTINWVKEVWKSVALMIKKDLKLLHVFKAMEDASLMGNKSSSLMLIWGAIEQLFSTNGGELKFRVASNLACYLEPVGNGRHQLFSELKKLYDQRSTAAHTVKAISDDAITHSYIYLRNAVVKIIDNNHIPNADDLEKLLFLGADDSN